MSRLYKSLARRIRGERYRGIAVSVEVSSLALAVLLVETFRRDLMLEGYGLAPDTRLAANILSASLALFMVISYLKIRGLLPAIGASYSLLELTLLREVSVARMLLMVSLTVIAVKAREALVRGLKSLVAESMMYLALMLAFLGIGYYTYRTGIYLPLDVLLGDQARFYLIFSSTRVGSFLFYVVALALATRIAISTIDLIAFTAGGPRIALEAARSYWSELERDVSSPLSGGERVMLLAASGMISLLLGALLYSLWRGGAGGATLLDIALGFLVFTALTLASRWVLLQLFKGSWIRILMASLSLLILSALILGPQPLFEALGLERAGYDPLAGLASPLLGLEAEERLRGFERIVSLLIRLLWGG